jgi:hypothetical protein
LHHGLLLDLRPCSYDVTSQAFAEGNKIGQGGFGSVYKGMLDGIPVAVKAMTGGPNAMQVRVVTW